MQPEEHKAWEGMSRIGLPAGVPRVITLSFDLLCFSFLMRIFAPDLKNRKVMQGLYSIGLLIISNIFMTLAWYGHLKLQEMKVISNWPLYGVILLSWGIALLEYCCQVPANRLGFRENGGPFSLMQLKVIQEVITLIIFTVFSVVFFKGESLHWNHIAAFGCLVLAVYFVFMK